MSFLISLNRTPGPTTHFEIFATKEPPPRNLAVAAENWQIESHPSHASYQVAFKNVVGRESAFRLITLLRDSQFDIRRVSVRPGLPHLFLILNLNQLPQTEAADLLRLLRNLADEVSNAPVDNSGLRRERPSGRRAKDKDPLSQKFPPPMTKPNLDLHSNGHHNGNGKLPLE